jgi:hypothetical protein
MRAKRYLFALMLTCLLAAPVGLLGASISLDWDSRLDALGVALVPAESCEGGCWKLVSAQYLGEQQSQGLHHIYIKLLDEQGNQLADTPWHTFYSGGDVRIMSKAAPDWSDFAMYSCYFPDRERGAYSAFAGDNVAQSDRVTGLGLPVCTHVSFRLVWKWQPASAPCVGCVPRGYLPFTSAP